MSSNYRIICMSHNPALVIYDREWNDHAPAVQAVVDGLGSHPDCRLLIGRWSGDICEIGCPRQSGAVQRHARLWHPHETQWIDAGWLRLVALSTPEAVAVARVPGCWDRDTVVRLAVVLGLEET